MRLDRGSSSSLCYMCTLPYYHSAQGDQRFRNKTPCKQDTIIGETESIKFSKIRLQDRLRCPPRFEIFLEVTNYRI